MKTSIVVPVFNSGESLQQLLVCLTRQKNCPEFEVVIVDDCSQQELAPIVEKYGRQLRLKFLRHEKNLGPGAARNTGIRAAVGEIVVFTDADCRPKEDWLENMLAPFADDSIAGVKGAYDCDQQDTWAQLAQLEFIERYELMESQPEIDFIDTYSGAYRRSDLLGVGGFAEELQQNEDVDLAFRIKKLGGRFVFVREAMVFHEHREGLKKYARLKFWRGFWRMKVYGRHPEKALKDSYTPFSLKAQLLLTLLLPFAVFSRKIWFWWKTAWLFACLPLLRIAYSKSPVQMMMIPTFCLVRAGALIAGMFAGVLAEVDKRFVSLPNLEKKSRP